jgi:hypothetical protein
VPRARVAVSVVLVALGLAACDPTPDQDTFYTAPADTSGAPGTVIRSRPSRFTLDPVARTPVSGVNAQQIVYRSTNALGQPMAVSGTVLVPTAPYAGPGPRPLVAYAVGTRGVGDACAPSYTLSQGTDYEGLFINNLLSQGWAVAVSDYEGLGMPGQHTYVVGQSEGRALLDVARAAIRLPGTGLSASTPVGLAGYSQGGGAAGWAAQLEATYAPELDVRGTAAGGIPGDLLATAEFVDGTPFVAVELLAAIGLDAAYPELDLEDHLNAEGEQLLDDAANVCLVSVDGVGTLFSTVFTSRSEYTTSDILADPAWLARLQQNRLGATRPAAPVFQYHGGIDEIVPFQQAADLRREWCNRGARVTWAVLPGEHVLGLVEGQPLATAWLQARFAGVPSLGNCLLP